MYGHRIVSHYPIAGALAFILWEHAITFDREYELIWKLGSLSSKCMFLVNRYGALIGLTYALAGENFMPIGNEFFVDTVTHSDTRTSSESAQ